MEGRFRFLGGRRTAFIQAIIRGIIGIVFILAGVIVSIVQWQIAFLPILGIIGIVTLLNAWYWWRRYQRLA